MKRALGCLLTVAFFISCDRELPLKPLDADYGNGKIVSTVPSASPVTFAKSFGQGPGSSGRSVIKTFDGGYAVAGTYGDDLDPIAYLFRTDRHGNLIWERTFGNYDLTILNVGGQLRQTPDSGFIMIGYNSETTVIKVDKNGQLQFEKTIFNVFDGTSIALSSDNGYVGISKFIDDTVSGFAVFKLNTAGNLLWTKKFPNAGAESIERTSDNGFIIAGIKDNNLYFLKINAQGNKQWESSFGGSYEDVGYHAIQTSDGGYIAVGINIKDTNGLHQIYLVKVDSQGKYKWIKGYFPSTTSIFKYKVRETTDHGYVIAGQVYGRGSLIKVGSTGSYSWRKDFPDSTLQWSFDVITESDEGYVLTGLNYNPSHEQQRLAALVRTDSRGNY